MGRATGQPGTGVSAIRRGARISQRPGDGDAAAAGIGNVVTPSKPDAPDLEPITSLASLKRRLAVPGTWVTTTHIPFHFDDAHRLGQTRTVNKVNSVAIHFDDPDTTFGISQVDLPKKEQFRIDGPNEFMMLDEDGQDLLGYRLETRALSEQEQQEQARQLQAGWLALKAQASSEEESADKPYRDVGVEPHMVSSLRERHLDPQTIALYDEALGSTISGQSRVLYADLVRNGITPDRARQWVSVGIKWPTDMVNYEAEDLTPEKVEQYHPSLRNSLLWFKSRGMDLGQANEYAVSGAWAREGERGLPTVWQIEDYIRRDVSPEKALAWQDAGLESRSDHVGSRIRDLEALGMSPADITPYTREGITEGQEIVALVGEGQTAPVVASYRTAGYEGAASVLTLSRGGVSPDRAASYRAATWAAWSASAGDIVALHQEGITPERAEDAFISAGSKSEYRDRHRFHKVRFHGTDYESARVIFDGDGAPEFLLEKGARNRGHRIEGEESIIVLQP